MKCNKRYALVMSQFQVKDDQYFPSFSYFARNSKM